MKTEYVFNFHVRCLVTSMIQLIGDGSQSVRLEGRQSTDSKGPSVDARCDDIVSRGEQGSDHWLFDITSANVTKSNLAKSSSFLHATFSYSITFKESQDETTAHNFDAGVRRAPENRNQFTMPSRRPYSSHCACAQRSNMA
jgi:hypothetical protein